MADELTTVLVPITHWINVYKSVTDGKLYCTGPFDTELLAMAEVPKPSDDDHVETVPITLAVSSAA
jgi:hypothetical protein